MPFHCWTSYLTVTPGWAASNSSFSCFTRSSLAEPFISHTVSVFASAGWLSAGAWLWAGVDAAGADAAGDAAPPLQALTANIAAAPMPRSRFVLTCGLLLCGSLWRRRLRAVDAVSVASGVGFACDHLLRALCPLDIPFVRADERSGNADSAPRADVATVGGHGDDVGGEHVGG